MNALGPSATLAEALASGVPAMPLIGPAGPPVFEISPGLKLPPEPPAAAVFELQKSESKSRDQFSGDAAEAPPAVAATDPPAQPVKVVSFASNCEIEIPIHQDD